MTKQVQQMFTDMNKPTEKPKIDLREPWWDRKYDNGKALYMWSQQKWIPAK